MKNKKETKKIKNLKIYKGVCALVLSAGIVLFSGCTDAKSDDSKSDIHEHVIVDFGPQSVIFRSCEGYDLYRYSSLHISGEGYGASLDDEEIVYVYSTNYTKYYTNHKDAAFEIEEEAIEKGAKVFTVAKKR